MWNQICALIKFPACFLIYIITSRALMAVNENTWSGGWEKWAPSWQRDQKQRKRTSQVCENRFHRFWFRIHLHYCTNIATWVFFQQFLQSFYVFVKLINVPFCKHIDGKGGIFLKLGGARVNCRFHGWRECPLLKYPWAKYCNDLPLVAVHKDALVCVYNPPQCVCLSTAAAETCLNNSGTDQGFNRKNVLHLCKKKPKSHLM